MSSFGHDDMDASTPPPPPPPKSGGHQAGDISSPGQQPRLPLPPPGAEAGGDGSAAVEPLPDMDAIEPDPGEKWLPDWLKDKTTQDLAEIVASSSLLRAVTHAPQTAHSSLKSSQAALMQALKANNEQAERLSEQAEALSRARAGTQAQLLATRALERTWRAKQADMDRALGPTSPAALYQRTAAGVVEQAAVCHALEESFLDGGGGGGIGAQGENATGNSGAGCGVASEREVAEWVRRYREAKVLLYQRQERKERWDAGRVGGWR
ncbi:hypothetical protein CDD82_4038 [Ophiocordyceps australis]|uniref:VPS37 C-terminal domain-containing protein n=1 Tax=Ophiocordyceps australis TaxID=1399860 RepID=A0A2C5Z8K8_9HYPO|nr:hypothetical protein CDD82_4038 [Ophiocordyceps australis]